MSLSKEQKEQVQEFLKEILVEFYGDLEGVIVAFPVIKNHEQGFCPFCEEQMIEEDPELFSERTYTCGSCSWCYSAYETKPEDYNEYIKYRRVKNKAESIK